MATIYCVINKINNKTYVGSTLRDPLTRWREHQYPSSKKLLSQDIRILGVNYFEFKILEEVSSEKIWSAERKWILKLNALKPYVYNTLFKDFQMS